MSGAKDPMAVHTRIWQEIAHPDNAFITETARCYGYDVYRDLLGKISWVEMLYLLFRGAAPSLQHKKLL